MRLDYDIDYVDPNEALIGAALGMATGLFITFWAVRQERALKKATKPLQPKIDPRHDDIIIRR